MIRTLLQKPIQAALLMRLEAANTREKEILAAKTAGSMDTSPARALVQIRQKHDRSNPNLRRGNHISSNLRPLISTKGRNDTMSEEIMGEKHAFIAPKLPTTGLLNVFSNYNHLDIGPYLNFLKYLETTAGDVQEEDMFQSELPKALRPKQYSEWLRSLLPIEGGVPTFRGLRTPAVEDLSLLARCIRFAKSRAEEHVCWAVHPKHVILICEYTNNYGVSPDRYGFKGEHPGLESIPFEGVRPFLGLDK